MTPEEFRAWVGAAIQDGITPDSLLGEILEDVPPGTEVNIAPKLGIKFDEPWVIVKGA